ncbi:MAG: RnfABCDGE type electron transport complex subunit D [Spirochaetes bacterium]|nr:RnfABCDGE type electron transport complex subunit D [Spirochaetota bacterium]
MIQPQKMMRKVILSLIPIYLICFYFYGLRLIYLSFFVFFFGILTEFIFEKFQGKKVSEAVLVSCMLFLLSLPPKTPWWIASLGIVFGILFGKEVFGGFGRNPFNPAIAGRLFVYISYSGFMQNGWIQFNKFSLWPDSVTSATPLMMLKNGENLDLLRLFFGLHAGSMGEGFIFLILVAGVYLIVTKTASWQIILSTFFSGVVLTLIFSFFKLKSALSPVESIMSGSFLFVTVFMATDPVSAPKKMISKFIYGLMIGSVTVLIRTFSSNFPEGTSFAVLFGNTFASLLDEIFAKKRLKQ